MTFFRNAMLVAAVALLAAATPVFAQTAPDVSKCFQVVGTSDYNFGSIDPDATVEHTFVFKNSCSTTIELDNPRASCGCTAALLSEKVIKPGEEAKIAVKFTPTKGSRGKQSKTVSVFLKGESNPHTILRFSADVKTDLDINPAYIQLLGAEVGKEASGTATLKNVTDHPVTVSEMTISMTAYADTSNVAGSTSSVMIPLNNAKVTPSTMTLKPGESKEVVVTLTPEHKGQVTGSIRFKTEKSEGFLQVFGLVRAGSGEGTGSSSLKTQ